MSNELINNSDSDDWFLFNFMDKELNDDEREDNVQTLMEEIKQRTRPTKTNRFLGLSRMPYNFFNLRHQRLFDLIDPEKRQEKQLLNLRVYFSVFQFYKELLDDNNFYELIKSEEYRQYLNETANEYDIGMRTIFINDRFSVELWCRNKLKMGLTSLYMAVLQMLAQLSSILVIYKKCGNNDVEILLKDQTFISYVDDIIKKTIELVIWYYEEYFRADEISQAFENSIKIWCNTYLLYPDLAILQSNLFKNEENLRKIEMIIAEQVQQNDFEKRLFYDLCHRLHGTLVLIEKPKMKFWYYTIKKDLFLDLVYRYEIFDTSEEEGLIYLKTLFEKSYSLTQALLKDASETEFINNKTFVCLLFEVILKVRRFTKPFKANFDSFSIDEKIDICNKLLVASCTSIKLLTRKINLTLK